MNPSEKLAIMALIYLVSGMEAHNLPVILKNTLGVGNDQARKTNLLNQLEKRLEELNDYEQYVKDSWKKHEPEFDDED